MNVNDEFPLARRLRMAANDPDSWDVPGLLGDAAEAAEECGQLLAEIERLVGDGLAVARGERDAGYQAAYGPDCSLNAAKLGTLGAIVETMGIFLKLKQARLVAGDCAR